MRCKISETHQAELGGALKPIRGFPEVQTEISTTAPYLKLVLPKPTLRCLSLNDTSKMVGGSLPDSTGLSSLVLMRLVSNRVTVPDLDPKPPKMLSSLLKKGLESAVTYFLIAPS